MNEAGVDLTLWNFWFSLPCLVLANETRNVKKWREDPVWTADN